MSEPVKYTEAWFDTASADELRAALKLAEDAEWGTDSIKRQRLIRMFRLRRRLEQLTGESCVSKALGRSFNQSKDNDQ